MQLLRLASRSLCHTRVISKTQCTLAYLQKLYTSTQQTLNVTISSDKVLSKANRKNCMKSFSSFKEIQFSTTKNLRRAAVLVPLTRIENEVALLYTERALHLKINGGEIAFPGGKFEESDGSCFFGDFRTLEKTALRETHEEIGLDPNKVDVWGKGPEIYRPDVKVTPVLAYMGELNLTKLKLNTDEVASIFAVTLENLCSFENFRVTRFRFGKTSVLVTPVYLGAEHRIWGLTAYITHLVLSSLIPDVYKKNIVFQPRIQKVISHNGNISNSEEIVFIK